MEGRLKFGCWRRRGKRERSEGGMWVLMNGGVGLLLYCREGVKAHYLCSTHTETENRVGKEWKGKDHDSRQDAKEDYIQY